MSLLILVPSGHKISTDQLAVLLSQQTGTPVWSHFVELKVAEVSNTVGVGDQFAIAELRNHQAFIKYSRPTVLIHPQIASEKRASLSRVLAAGDNTIRLHSPGKTKHFDFFVCEELKLRKLTWKARLENDLKHVHGVAVGSAGPTFDQWLKQFEDVGYSGVGDWIGRCISICPTASIIDKLGLDSLPQDLDTVLLTKHQGSNLVLLHALQGRLGQFLHKLASKRVGTELSGAMKGILNGKKYLLVTDWIHTGGEIMQALLPTCGAYSDYDLVNAIRQNIGSFMVRPALATRYGILRLRKCFENLGLPDILDLTRTEILENLRSDVVDMSLVKLDDVSWQQANICTELECRMKALHAKKADIDVVINAVKKLGSSLVQYDPLGSRSLGLTTNSVYSIPQGSLAVLRHSGHVPSNPQNPSHTKKWIPLFQHTNLGSL